MGRSRYVGTVSDDLLAVLATLTPSARAMLRQTLLRDGDNPGETSRIWVSGHEGGDDYLLDDLVYAINRRTLDPAERDGVVQMLDEINDGSTCPYGRGREEVGGPP